MSDNINFDYKNLSPFKWFVLENFPFIEADFDALTEWQLFCKIGKEINKIIDSQNIVGEQAETLTNAFNNLKNYVDNYFENLDVQDEINNKLNEMVEDGELTTLINNYFSEVNDRLNLQDTRISEFNQNLTNKINSQNSVIDSFKTQTNQNMENFESSINSQFSDLEDDINETISVQDNKIANLSTSKPVFVSSTSDMTNQSTIYVLTTNNHIYSYSSNSGSFVDTGATYSTVGNALPIYPTVINSNTYAEMLPDLNNALDNNIYSILFSSSAPDNTLPLHLPSHPKGNPETLLVYKNNITVNQIYFSRDTIYLRTKYSNQSFTDWIILGNNQYPFTINASNYASLLPDLNNAKNNQYLLNFASASTSSNMPANLPEHPHGDIDYLFNFKSNNSQYQIYFTQDNIFWRYAYQNNWRAWKSLGTSGTERRIFYVGESEQFTSLKAGLEEATNYMNSTLYVRDGVYDLYQEFGAEFFENFTSESQKGLILKNNVHVIFSSNSKVVFNYNGNNNNVCTYFSPFNSGDYGFTLENATIESSGCRYSVHDERGGSKVPYKNHYINCKMTHNNQNGGFTQVLGGGLGGAGEVIIENCEFSQTNPSTQNNTRIVSYHANNSSTNTQSKSKVVLKDSYFNQGTFSLTWCGVSTLITECYVTNCKLNSQILHQAERQGTDLIKNTRLIEWNNIIN